MESLTRSAKVSNVNVIVQAIANHGFAVIVKAVVVAILIIPATDYFDQDATDYFDQEC